MDRERLRLPARMTRLLVKRVGWVSIELRGLCGHSRDRTCDRRLKRPLLYQLSYVPKKKNWFEGYFKQWS